MTGVQHQAKSIVDWRQVWFVGALCLFDDMKNLFDEIAKIWPLAIGASVGIGYIWWAFFNDKNLWRNKPRSILLEMIAGSDWTVIQPALQELKRRGESIEPYVDVVLRLLISDSRLKRAAGKAAVQKFYPQIARDLGDYKASAPIEVCRGMVVPVMKKLGIDEQGL